MNCEKWSGRRRSGGIPYTQSTFSGGGCFMAGPAAIQANIRLHSTCERNGQRSCLEMDQVRYREMGMSCLTWEFHHTVTGKLVYVL